MELAVKAAAICIVAALCVSFLKRSTPELGLLLSLAAAIVVLGCILTYAEGAAAILDELLGQTGLDRELFTPLFKIIGISLVSRLGTDLCKDAGQGTLASLVELSGTLCALLAAAPLLAAAAKVFGGWLL